MADYTNASTKHCDVITQRRRLLRPFHELELKKNFPQLYSDHCKQAVKRIDEYINDMKRLFPKVSIKKEEKIREQYLYNIAKLDNDITKSMIINNIFPSVPRSSVSFKFTKRKSPKRKSPKRKSPKRKN